jgi:uncharacterized hydrophobic protein (TIGR00271 family)
VTSTTPPDPEIPDGPETAEDAEAVEGIDRWVNPATARGAMLVGAGVVVLAVPRISIALLGLVLALGLVGIGLLDVWSELRSRGRSIRRIIVGLVAVGAGVGLLVSGERTVELLTTILAIVVAVRGVSVAAGGIRSRRTNPNWVFDIVRGLFFLAFAAIVFFLPDALVRGAIAIAAVGSTVIGAILIAFGSSHPEEAELGSDELGGLVKRWIDERDVGTPSREELVEGLYFEEPDAGVKERGFWVLLILSVVIATFGVLADSTAVVIGAMLVAPLMTPIMGASAGIVNGWTGRMMRSFATVAGGVAVAIGVAWIVAAWTPQLVPLATNSQITSRTSPTMIDLMIAIAAGAACAYAIVDKRVSSSITGVAIAVALVPPLGVVGILLYARSFDDALGAFLLFLTNLVSIILVAGIVFLLMGLAPLKELGRNREKNKTVIATVLLGAVVIVIPLAFTSEGIIASASRQAVTQEVIEEWLEDTPGISVLRAEISAGSVDVRLSGEGEVPAVAELEQQLEAELGIDVSVRVEFFPSETITSDV